MPQMHSSISAMLFWVVLLLVLLILPCSTRGSSCLPHERLSLLHFKASVDDPSDRLHSWRAFNCCQWTGVQCHPRTGHVIALHLSNPNHYTSAVWNSDEDPYSRALRSSGGDVISPFCNLQQLERLDLRENDFFGAAISPCLGRLKKLRYLDLANAEFTGTVPKELGNMSSLQHLDLSCDWNCFDSPLRIPNLRMWRGNMRHLRELLLDFVNMSQVASDEWGAALSSMPNLTRIRMSYCGISGVIPSSLGNLTHLAHLELGGNNLVSLPASLLNLSNLVSLSVRHNHLNGSIPSSLLRLPRLQQIDLSGNPPLRAPSLQESENSYLRGDLSLILPHHSTSLKRIYLSGVRMEGFIPDYVGNISTLTVLALKHCGINGTVPRTIANLSGLVSLDLSDNELEGSILPVLVELLQLQYVDLGGNKFEGNIPRTISQLSRLKRLLLNSNRFNGTFSESYIGNLSRLEEMDISDNLLTVEFSSTWIPSCSLKILLLKSCNMTGELPAFLVTQYDMSILDLSNNSLRGSIPPLIWDSLALQYLNLSHNQLDGPLPNNLAGSTHLQYLDLHNNSLQGSIPLPPPDLILLDLSENQFNSSIPAEIGENLTDFTLLLSHNNLSGSIPHSICGQTYGAIVLSLSHNRLTGKIPSTCLSSNLLVLDLEKNYLEGELSLGLMPSLQVLKLGGNRLNGSIPSSLANCKKLKILDLGENNLTGKLLKWIVKLSSLKILILKSNSLEGKIPSEVTKLSFLQVLDLSNNNFSGSVPKSISNFSAMANSSANKKWDTFQYLFNGVPYWFRYGSDYSSYTANAIIRNKGQDLDYAIILGLVKCIDLSNNNLTGAIPPQLGLLKGLKILNISRNHISGDIPESLGNLTMLESLDLSHNLLSGKFPSELQSLTFLAHLNVSYNNLSGIIPQGNQFLTYDPSAFSNNPGLCGIQINKSCTPSTHSVQENFGDKDEEGEDVWWQVAVGLSYGLGFGVVITVLCLKKRCLQWMDNIIIRLF